MRSITVICSAVVTMLIAPLYSAHAADLAKKVCYADAKRLCADAVKALSRKRAEACLFQKIEQTSPTCHAMIVQVHAQREKGVVPR